MSAARRPLPLSVRTSAPLVPLDTCLTPRLLAAGACVFMMGDLWGMEGEGESVVLRAGCGECARGPVEPGPRARAGTVLLSAWFDSRDAPAL